jgi:hypothetical protein
MSDEIQQLKDARNAAMREAEKLAYDYFKQCEDLSERMAAHKIYENLRLAGAVYF